MWEGASSGKSIDVSLMSADELAEYEDKKLKMRKVITKEHSSAFLPGVCLCCSLRAGYVQQVYLGLGSLASPIPPPLLLVNITGEN